MVGNQPLEPAVFVLELPEPSELAHAQMRELLLPLVEGRFAGLVTPPESVLRGYEVDFRLVSQLLLGRRLYAELELSSCP